MQLHVHSLGVDPRHAHCTGVTKQRNMLLIAIDIYKLRLKRFNHQDSKIVLYSIIIRQHRKKRMTSFFFFLLLIKFGPLLP